MRVLIGGGIGFALGLAAVFLIEPRPVERADRSLEKQLAEERARTRELEGELEKLRAGATAPSAVTEDPSVEPARKPREVPAPVRDAATALRVPDDVLRVALEASEGDRSRVSLLKGSGVEGFRALVAMVRGGYPVDVGLFATVWNTSMAGEELALIDVAESADFVPASVALSALGHCDTSRTREYLVWRLRGDTEGRFLHACAESLGRLREPAALPDLAQAIRNRKAPAPQRATALFAITDIGGSEATSILLHYVRDPEADTLATGFIALARIDGEAARREAAALLAGPRATSLSAGERDVLRQYAGEK